MFTKSRYRQGKLGLLLAHNLEISGFAILGARVFSQNNAIVLPRFCDIAHCIHSCGHDPLTPAWHKHGISIEWETGAHIMAGGSDTTGSSPDFWQQPVWLPSLTLDRKSRFILEPDRFHCAEFLGYPNLYDTALKRVTPLQIQTFCNIPKIGYPKD